ncbi:CYTH domain-containing protein [Aggregatimonas sangjinii]|uniref:CYTH domain-containing protein n=1 Tax=Aggregatimonas sangjinii TaxID=2583587 RepID=A0A5B7SZ36_9FLAO|nr:CYTH domain-containing protein [Aggregatimonas sangjinii]QCX02054.1 CYTH domain-containing protein [Aggregatimonas sangjinii]
MIEIERKFLVCSDAFKTEAISEKRIVQGFLNTHPERTVRVRIKGAEGFLTIKGKSNESGTTRYEWEETIALTDAEDLLKLCEEGMVAKTRYEIPIGKHKFEVDEFLGLNKGLVVAELELKDEGEFFEKPIWLGLEVTGELKYYNSQLSKNPYKHWKK